ncbi:MAG: extracellular solute-binding protein [Bacillus subtilis]|nr:extracellular solute-binding protein [Bacillus subtilis]
MSAFRGRSGVRRNAAIFYPEQALIPMIYDEGLYGLPDTENFYVLFYRTDILDTLDLTVPDTWDDVVKMMPTLRRYGMNFYIPLSCAVLAQGVRHDPAVLVSVRQSGVFRRCVLRGDLNNDASIDGAAR